MSRRCFGRTPILLLLLLAALALPRPAHADFWDFVWEMSGPQMIGARLGCRIGFDGKACHVFGKAIGDRPPLPRQWIALEGGIYTSTNHDSETTDYEWFKVHMLAVEPMFEGISNPGAKVKLVHGAGITYNFLFGQDFRRFDKFGLKFKPVAAIFPRIEVAYTLRLYPNGFTADELGDGERVTSLNRPWEAVHGFAISW